MIYTFQNQQLIKANIHSVWSYFNNPKHINELTPVEMNFRTLTQNLPNKIHKDLIIAYKVSPLFGISLKWKTEIISVENHKSFIDIQIKGPYKKWHHLHTFEQTEEGTLITDLITYELPFGLIGDLVHRILVKKKIEKLFTYRTQQINKQFKND